MILIIAKLWKPIPAVQRECANQPCTLAQIEAVRKVRECYPHGSKDKLAVVKFNRYSKRNAKKRKSKLFVLPPRSPQLNGAVERANRTHAEEFYEVIDSTFDLADIRPELL